MSRSPRDISIITSRLIIPAGMMYMLLYYTRWGWCPMSIMFRNCSFMLSTSEVSTTIIFRAVGAFFSTFIALKTLPSAPFLIRSSSVKRKSYWNSASGRVKISLSASTGFDTMIISSPALNSSSCLIYCSSRWKSKT